MESTTLLLPAIVFICAYISGSTGVLGGTILLAILIAIFPVTEAMVLHGILQGCLNGFRTYFFWKHVRLQKIIYFLLGTAIIYLLLMEIQFSPSRSVVYICLGLTGLIGGTISSIPGLSFEKATHVFGAGVVTTACIIITGVGGPIIDTLFVHSGLNRLEVMGTKSIIQSFTHIIKITYFLTLMNESQAFLFEQSLLIPTLIFCSFLGTFIGKYTTHAMSECTFNQVTRVLVSLTGVGFLYQGILG